MNWYKNHTLYEFVLYNSYKKLYEFVIQFVLYKFVLVNLYTKISEKKICIRVGISTRTNIRSWPFSCKISDFFRTGAGKG